MKDILFGISIILIAILIRLCSTGIDILSLVIGCYGFYKCFIGYHSVE